jgi:hypothetical protein
MNLDDLAKLTGQKSVSEMTDEELMEHLRVVRQSRLVCKGVETHLIEKIPKKTREQRKVAAKIPFPDASQINNDKLDELALLLGDLDVH